MIKSSTVRSIWDQFLRIGLAFTLSLAIAFALMALDVTRSFMWWGLDSGEASVVFGVLWFAGTAAAVRWVWRIGRKR